jgi:radical SAM-linked protein
MRVRLRFTKEGKVRFTSHRDVARILERMARRAQLPLAYSQGYSPRPRLHFGLALPTGCASAGEYVDVDLDTPVDVESLPALLTAFLPPGMAVTAAAEIEGARQSLQEAVTSCTWTVELPGVRRAEAQAAIDRVLASDEVLSMRSRKGREVVEDVRPAIHEITVDESDDGVVLWMELATHPRGARPSDVLPSLDPAWEPTCTRREQQWIATNGARLEPLAPTTTERPHARERAS